MLFDISLETIWQHLFQLGIAFALALPIAINREHRSDGAGLGKSSARAKRRGCVVRGQESPESSGSTGTTCLSRRVQRRRESTPRHRVANLIGSNVGIVPDPRAGSRLEQEPQPGAGRRYRLTNEAGQRGSRRKAERSRAGRGRRAFENRPKHYVTTNPEHWVRLWMLSGQSPTIESTCHRDARPKHRACVSVYAKRRPRH